MAALHVEIGAAPRGCEEYHKTLLTPDAVQFVTRLIRRFDKDVEQLYRRRQQRKLDLNVKETLPDFLPETQHIRQSDWKVKPLPARLRCRHVDLGDVSPSNTEHFKAALKSSAQGIQTDFDDGHCPEWSNQLLGLYNVYCAVHGRFTDVHHISRVPVLMLRPRAWNMPEHNMLVDGKEVAGPLFDFGLLMFHNARLLHSNASGPFFYLSKVEGYLEARLWNDIFKWTEEEMKLPIGSIKACVLIENVLASFEMEEILFELRDHSAGLNCGIWDYSASFINKFGHRASFVLPDRNKYVSMDRHFLKSYMDLVVQVCHKREALATGGMAAPVLLSHNTSKWTEVIEKVCSAKLKEIKAGVDGFMVYDIKLLKPTQQLFQRFAPTDNQIHIKRSDVNVGARDLLLMPSGGVTYNGLKHNIGVGIFFILAWFQGKGHYYFKGAVEDSATAEISRSQVWQWLRHRTTLEDASGQSVTRRLVKQLITDIIQEELSSNSKTVTSPQKVVSDHLYQEQLLAAAALFEEIVTCRAFHDFITSFLYSDHTFLAQHESFQLTSSI